jgi:hypothetical protein
MPIFKKIKDGGQVYILDEKASKGFRIQESGARKKSNYGILE